MSRFRPLRITAHLASGIAQSAPWGIALDGLIAAEIWAEQKAAARAAGDDYTRAMDQVSPPDLDLPLSRCMRAGDDLWHWASTCGYHGATSLPTDVRTWTGRLDHRDLETVATDLPKVISERQGRYRARLMPLLVTPCSSITWHAIGDRDDLQNLLGSIMSIGKKRSSGEGHVLSWEIEPDPTLDDFTAAHLHPDGTLGRPTPASCLRGLSGVSDGGVGLAGLRPPYMHQARQRELRLPALLAV